MVLERSADQHTCVFAVTYQLGYGLSERELVQCVRWREVRPGVCQVVNVPVERDDRPRGEGTVRGQVYTMTEIERVDPGESKVAHFAHGTLGVLGYCWWPSE